MSVRRHGVAVPSNTVLARIRTWSTAQRNVTIFAAILVGVPTAYAFTRALDGGGGGDFLLLVTLAVGVPTAYDEYWPRYDRTWKAVAWVVLACAVAAAEFTGVYLVLDDVVALSPVAASVGAFLATTVGNAAWLARRRG
jgi:hypothetical protein